MTGKFSKLLSLYLLTMTVIAAYPANNKTTVFQLNIWEGTGVDKNVEMTCYPSSRPNAPAIIVCPGGSYFWHAMDTEGHQVAKWLNDNGISAYVLKYRAAGISAFIYHTRWFYRGNRYPDMMEDVQRAISIIRSDPQSFNADPNHLGVMGFSAGGHLALMSAINFKTDFLKPLRVDNSVSLRPDFIASIYPVVSMSSPVTHKRSRRGLLGENGNHKPKMLDSLSLEKHAHKQMPPVFLMNCTDDPIVDYRNSILMDSALTATGVDHFYIRFSNGGHGFGVNPQKMSEEAAKWPALFIDWLNNLLNQKN